MANRKIQNLIVGVDLSRYSKTVVREAKALSQKLKIPLTYVYVFQDLAIFDRKFAIRKPEVRKHFGQVIRRKYLLKKDDTVVVRYGRPPEEIIATAKSCKRPLILTGHRGHSPMVRFFIGSTAERLTLLSPFPVWIHRSQKIVLPEKILIPCDLSQRSHHTIAEVNFFNKTFKAALELYHVMQEPIPILDFQAYTLAYDQIKKADDKRVRDFRRTHPSLKTVTAIGGVVDRIQDHAKNFDIIAISPRNHHKSMPFFGGVTAKLLRSGDRPVLIIP